MHGVVFWQGHAAATKSGPASHRVPLCRTLMLFRGRERKRNRRWERVPLFVSNRSSGSATQRCPPPCSHMALVAWAFGRILFWECECLTTPCYIVPLPMVLTRRNNNVLVPKIVSAQRQAIVERWPDRDGRAVWCVATIAP